MKKNKSFIKKLVGFLVALVLVVGSIYTILYRNAKNPEAENLFVALMKDRPTLMIGSKADGMIDSIEITINCKAGYDQVIFQLLMYDEEERIISSYTLQESNLTKDETRKVIHSFTSEEYLYTHSFTIKLISYK